MLQKTLTSLLRGQLPREAFCSPSLQSQPCPPHLHSSFLELLSTVTPDIVLGLTHCLFPLCQPWGQLDTLSQEWAEKNAFQEVSSPKTKASPNSFPNV